MSDAAPISDQQDLPLCDIVMKGGITSGIVYPPAIIELASRYRFSSIGGTSAGGIVAALTAAAEYARQNGLADAFTGRMAAIAGELQTPGTVKNLFKPVSALRAPYYLFLQILKGKSPASYLINALLGMIGYTPVGFLLGALFGLAVWRGIADGILYAEHWAHLVFPDWLHWVLNVIGFIVFALLNGLIGGAISLILQISGRLPNNRYGVCTGFSADEDNMATETQPASSSPKNAEGRRKSATTILTNWLHENINYLAGRSYGSPPLTIAELDKAGISLRMMTSNLSQAQPYVVPFRQNIFLFKKVEMDTLFPQVVVDHLVKYSHQSSRVLPPEGYYFLPDADDFPLIVAARLSLSFPVLISAVRFYTVKQSAYREKVNQQTPKRLAETDLDANIFSDGGISSNFPIHFFDAWFPTNPTFGINLTNWSEDSFQPGNTNILRSERLAATAQEMHPDAARQVQPANDPEQAVYLPRANSDTPPEVQPIGGFGGFIMAIFNIAQNFRDNAQSHLPSYRERIVQVRLADNEGGLNLDMPLPLIQQMMEKGRVAGQKLTQEFQFGEHQWVRLLVLMQQLEFQLHFLKTSLTPEGYQALTDAMLTAQKAGEPFPYSRDGTWLKAANRAMPALFELLKEWEKVTCFDQEHPHPEAVLRVTPDFDVYEIDKSSPNGD